MVDAVIVATARTGLAKSWRGAFNMSHGATGANIARQIALRAGLPVTSAGVTVNRYCASSLQAIPTASPARA